MKELFKLVPKNSHYFLLIFPVCDLILIILSALGYCDCAPIFINYFVKILEKGQFYFIVLGILVAIQMILNFILKFRKR